MVKVHVSRTCDWQLGRPIHVADDVSVSITHGVHSHAHLFLVHFHSCAVASAAGRYNRFALQPDSYISSKCTVQHILFVWLKEWFDSLGSKSIWILSLIFLKVTVDSWELKVVCKVKSSTLKPIVVIFRPSDPRLV